MYKEIDELIETICQDNIFVEYYNAEKSLHDEKIMLLLSRHQTLQDDYLRMKQFKDYVSNDELKKQLLDIKKEMTSNPIIQNYYQRYYEMNELLEMVTSSVFEGISHELSFDTLTL